jgi:hypothetical protein
MEREDVAKRLSDDDFDINTIEDEGIEFFNAGEFKLRSVWELKTPKFDSPAFLYHQSDTPKQSRGPKTAQPYFFLFFFIFYFLCLQYFS